MSPKPLLLYLRLSDLAEAAEMHSSRIEKCIYRGVIEPDAEIKHGRSTQPIFLQSRVAEHIRAIRRHQELLEKEIA
jgi:hypothetical protein